MKLTKGTLKQIIKEELDAVMSEDSSNSEMIEDVKNAYLSAYYTGDGSPEYSVVYATMALKNKYPDITEEKVKEIIKAVFG